MRVDVTTLLDCAPDQAILHVQTPRLLEFVAHPLVRFEPVEPNAFPQVWTAGTYWVRLRIFGFIPFGRQAVVISFPHDPERFLVRDNGHSKLIRVWDHLISITPESGRTRYRDTVTIRAGVFTPLIWLFAQIFYRHRQRRWRKLVQREFRFGHD